jgi:hypothetical protein
MVCLDFCSLLFIIPSNELFYVASTQFISSFMDFFSPGSLPCGRKDIFKDRYRFYPLYFTYGRNLYSEPDHR